MAPEKVCSFIVLDLELAGDSLKATRHVSPEGPRLLLKWYPLPAPPQGFRAIAGGVIHVPKTVVVEPAELDVVIERLHSGHHYRDFADILVAVMPRGAHLGDARPGPSGAKSHDGRLAVYWLAPAGGAIDVEWSTVSAGADPSRAALAINTEVRRTTTPLPRLSIDDCELYDVAVSYASEDRAHAEPLLHALATAGCHTFYDDDSAADLGLTHSEMDIDLLELSRGPATLQKKLTIPIFLEAMVELRCHSRPFERVPPSVQPPQPDPFLSESEPCR